MMAGRRDGAMTNRRSSRPKWSTMPPFGASSGECGPSGPRSDAPIPVPQIPVSGFLSDESFIIVRYDHDAPGGIGPGAAANEETMSAFANRIALVALSL